MIEIYAMDHGDSGNPSRANYHVRQIGDDQQKILTLYMGSEFDWAVEIFDRNVKTPLTSEQRRRLYEYAVSGFTTEIFRGEEE